MKNAISLILFVLLASLLIFTEARGADDWVLKKDKDGIQVFSRKVKNSPLLAFKAIIEVDYPISKVATVLKDHKRRAEWVPGILEIRIVEKLSLTEHIEYQKLATPWPLQDRDILVHGKILFNEEKKQFEIWVKSIERDDVPPKSGVVRSKIMGSSYLMKPLSKDRTRLTVEIHLDPMGMVPKWLVNWVQKGWSYKYMQGFRAQISKTDIAIEDDVKKKFSTFGMKSGGTFVSSAGSSCASCSSHSCSSCH